MEKRSFFERLTGSVKIDEPRNPVHLKPANLGPTHISPAPASVETEEEAQLTVDVWQTPDEIIIQSIVAGVKPEDLDVSISQDSITLTGKRERAKEVAGSDFFYQELYWGTFSRSVLLPQEIDPDESEATIKNGLVTIRLPKLDKTRIQKLKIKNE
ncbi:MAG: Hsp20/alpha crystallin family protein [bacterium]|nr:Hsp20/alpha crystallin family protein [bacterium]